MIIHMRQEKKTSCGRMAVFINKRLEWGTHTTNNAETTGLSYDAGSKIESSLRPRGTVEAVDPPRVSREVLMRARVRSYIGGGTSRKYYLLLVGGSSLASCWCEHRGKCPEARRGTATRESHPRSIVHRKILESNMRLEMSHNHELPSVHARAKRKSQRRTKVPLFLHPVCHLHPHTIRLFDHTLSPSPRPHSRRANGIFLISTKASISLSSWRT